MNITDALVPFFSGEKTFDEAVESATQLFIRCCIDYSYECEICGKLVYAKITTNEHGIFVEDSRTEFRGGKGNKLIKKNVCEECAQIYTCKYL